MTVYLACLIAGLSGIGLVFSGRKSEPVMIIGGAIYFIALFVAAIYSLHGGAQ